MTTAQLSALDIAVVAERLGLQLEKLGAGLARPYRDQDALPLTLNLDAHTVRLTNGEEGGPIELVMSVLSYSREDATGWLKENLGKEDRMEIIETDIRNVKLAQDFAGGIGYYTAALYVKKGGSIIQQPHIVTSKRELFPCTAAELQNHSIFYERLPFPRVRWDRKELMLYTKGNTTVPTLADCFHAITSEMNKYLDFGDRDISAMITLWIIGTYCYRVFPSFPYLHLNGSAGCGKTKTLQFITELSFNGELFSSNTSPAAILRVIDANCSSCCIDEVEGISQGKDDDSRAVLAVLNTGYKLGGGDLKCEQNGKKQWIPIWYDGYCPKVLAGIKTLDATLASRCIPVLMLRTHNKEILNRDLPIQGENFSVIRSMLYPATLETFPRIQHLTTTVQSVTLTGREWELWKPLIILGSIIDPTGELPNRMRALAQRIQNARRETDVGTPLVLGALEALLVQEKTEEKFFTTEELYQFLASHDEIFEWLLDPSRKSARGKWLGNELRRSGVVQGKAELKSIHGEKSKGYTIRRPIVRSLLSAYEGNTVTVESPSAEPSREGG